MPVHMSGLRDTCTINNHKNICTGYHNIPKNIHWLPAFSLFPMHFTPSKTEIIVSGTLNL